MNLRMATHTAAALRDRRPVPTGNARGGGLSREQRLNRSVGGVARLAQEGCARFQHVLRCGAMWIVAVGAVVVDRLVAVNKRAAFFHVAGITSLHHRVALDQFGANRSVHVMAVGASHLALRNGVMRWLVDLRTLLFVAREAKIRLQLFVTHLVVPVVDNVAGRAGNVTGVVGAARPMRALGIAIVAI